MAGKTCELIPGATNKIFVAAQKVNTKYKILKYKLLLEEVQLQLQL